MGLSAGLVSPEGPVVSGGSTGGAVDDIYELRLRIKDATPSGPPPMVGADGIEPSTSSVSRKRSTTEPRAYSEAKRQRLTGGCGSVNDLAVSARGPWGRSPAPGRKTTPRSRRPPSCGRAPPAGGCGKRP